MRSGNLTISSVKNEQRKVTAVAPLFVKTRQTSDGAAFPPLRLPISATATPPSPKSASALPTGDCRAALSDPASARSIARPSPLHRRGSGGSAVGGRCAATAPVALSTSGDAARWWETAGACERAAARRSATAG